MIVMKYIILFFILNVFFSTGTNDYLSYVQRIVPDSVKKAYSPCPPNLCVKTHKTSITPICIKIEQICRNSTHTFIPNFDFSTGEIKSLSGTLKNKCDFLWGNAKITDESTKRTLTCANKYLDMATNNAEDAPFFCALLGIPIPGMTGCWD